MPDDFTPSHRLLRSLVIHEGALRCRCRVFESLPKDRSWLRGFRGILLREIWVLGILGRLQGLFQPAEDVQRVMKIMIVGREIDLQRLLEDIGGAGDAREELYTLLLLGSSTDNAK